MKSRLGSQLHACCFVLLRVQKEICWLAVRTSTPTNDVYEFVRLYISVLSTHLWFCMRARVVCISMICIFLYVCLCEYRAVCLSACLQFCMCACCVIVNALYVRMRVVCAWVCFELLTQIANGIQQMENVKTKQRQNKDKTKTKQTQIVFKTKTEMLYILLQIKKTTTTTED